MGVNGTLMSIGMYCTETGEAMKRFDTGEAAGMPVMPDGMPGSREGC